MESGPPSKHPKLEEMTKEELDDGATPEWKPDSTFELTPTINFQLYQITAQYVAETPKIMILKSPKF